MNRIAGILQELYGLVVDDGIMAAATIVWTAIVWLVSRSGVAPVWSGFALAAGLVAILIESVLRHARR